MAILWPLIPIPDPSMESVSYTHLLLLTGSLLFGGIPVYAGEYSNVELSAEDDGSDLTVDSDSAADMAASDDTVASEDTNLSIDWLLYTSRCV